MIINQIHKKIVKGGGGDLSDIGTPVTVQATDNFSVGDTFMGNAIIGNAPIITRVQSGYGGSIRAISKDGTVIYPSTSLSATSTTAVFYIKNGGGYSEIKATLPDMTGASSTDYVTINENGTKAIYNLSSFILIFDIDKENMTITAKRIDISSIDMSDASFDGYPCTLNKFNTTIQIIGNYIFAVASVNYTYSGTSSRSFGTMYAELTDTGLKNIYFLYCNSTSTYCSAGSMSEIIKYGDNDLIFLKRYYDLQRVEISNGKVVSHNSIRLDYSFITANGKFLTYQKNLYKINQETGTCTVIATFSQAITGVDETGQYVFYNNNCYRVSDTTLSASLGNAYPSYGYYKITDGQTYFDTSKYLTTLLPSSRAEYLISHTNVVPSGGDIYGIITEAMSMGEVKKAAKLFSKAGGEDVVPTFVEYIQSSGTQYIDTDFIASSEKVKYEIKFAPTSNANGQAFWGQYRSDKTSTIINGYTPSNGNLRFYVGGSDGATALDYSISSNTVYELTLEANNGTFTRTVNGITATASYSGTLNKTDAPLIFAQRESVNNTVTAYARMRLYYFKIYDNGTLVRDFKPAFLFGEYCLYDEVEKEFYYNAGSGKFTGGV